ncbi:hypothetical protein OAR19_00100 [bacterium]|nr:hypothetical protein [bacterium]
MNINNIVEITFHDLSISKQNELIRSIEKECPDQDIDEAINETVIEVYRKKKSKKW